MTKKIDFDKETGAIERKIQAYGSDQKTRGFGRTAKQDDHPLLKAQISVIAGATGSGKTILALNVLDEIIKNADPKRLGKVMIYSGSPSDKALKSIDAKIATIYGPSQTVSLLNDLTDLTNQMDLITDESERPLSILLLDDVAASKVLSPSQVKGSQLGELLVSHRHVGLHVVIMAQRIKGQISPWVLANMSNLFLFAGKSQQDIQELSRNLPFPKESLDKALQSIATEPHAFLYINLKHKTIMKGLSDVILS